jgi:DNA-binding CsgD family transcriptional regulator
MQPRGLRVSEDGVAAICGIAAVAASAGRVDERAAEVLELLGSVIPIAAAAASVIDPVTGQQRILVNMGYNARLAKHVTSPAYHSEVIEPFAMPLLGWPVRERDLRVDPLSLRAVAEYFRPEGLTEGLVSALTTPDGRHVGTLDISVSDQRHPSDEACAIIGHLAPALANLTDPLQSARALAASLDDQSTAIAILPGLHAFPLLGEPDAALLDSKAPLLDEATRALRGRRPMAGFLWPRGDGGWYACRAVSCRDNVTVLLLREDPDLNLLTLRELEVLTSLAQGLSNEEIARKLWIAHRTARTHVEHIFAKLDVSTRAAAVARATQDGLLLPARAIELLR